MKNVRSLAVLSALALFVFPFSAASQQKTYYVSPSGDDSNSGLSKSRPWKTLSKVNETAFLPGDKILFKSGETWYGQLDMKGSGAEGKPITIASYGGSARPVINIGEAEGAGIRINDESWWTVEHIEITSGAQPKLGIGRQGISITARTEGIEASHFVVRDCYIHDIWGQMGGNTEYCGYYSCGVLVRVVAPKGYKKDGRFKLPRMNDVLIENNRIERMDKCGIISWGPRNNVTVRGNYLDNLGGDGIFVNGTYRGMIEKNEIHRACMRSGYADLPGGESWWPHTAACWIQDAEETVMQFNEVYDTGREPRNGDGFAYDLDFHCSRCLVQYNYSQSNHGLILMMWFIDHNVVRYNISENDQYHLLQIGCNINDDNVLYNNVFYVDHGTADLDYDPSHEKPEALGAYFYNNIFYATGQARFRIEYHYGAPENRKFDEELNPKMIVSPIFRRNCFYGPWKNRLPDDPEAIMADPMFVAPGTGGHGLGSLEGYHLKSGSPCRGAGIMIKDNGGRDFYGTSLKDGKTDIGAAEND